MFLRNFLIRVENHDIQLDMFIRRTKISSSSSGEAHYTFRLVASKRTGKKVQQKTLLNLGANFSLPKELWPQLCSRINEIITGQLTFGNNQPEEIEQVAQHYAARLVNIRLCFSKAHFFKIFLNLLSKG
jgi:hypothetical protein